MEHSLQSVNISYNLACFKVYFFNYISNSLKISLFKNTSKQRNNALQAGLQPQNKTLPQIPIYWVKSSSFLYTVLLLKRHNTVIINYS